MPSLKRAYVDNGEVSGKRNEEKREGFSYLNGLMILSSRPCCFGPERIRSKTDESSYQPQKFSAREPDAKTRFVSFVLFVEIFLLSFS